MANRQYAGTDDRKRKRRWLREHHERMARLNEIGICTDRIDRGYIGEQCDRVFDETGEHDKSAWPPRDSGKRGS